MSPDDAPRMTLWDAAAKHLAVLYATTVREIRSSAGASQLGLILNILQTLAYVGAFYVLFVMIGRRDAGLRGDTMMFLLSGVLLFRMHVETMSKVMGAVSANQALLNYEPTKSVIFVWARALTALYEFLLVTILMIGAAALARGELELHHPFGLIAPILAAWLSGVGVGLLFMFAQAHFSWFGVISTLYRRVLMFTSGKFFVANAVPTVALPFLWWNPLFHAIDLTRGAIFVNYAPRNTSFEVMVSLALGLLVIGHVFEARLHRALNRARS